MTNKPMHPPVRSAAPMRALWTVMLGLALALGQSSMAVANAAPTEGFADLAAKVAPAVVDITTLSTVAAPTQQGPMVPPGSPFEQFFHDFMNQNGQNGQQPSQPQHSEALGSGFVISPDGYIVTNNHVIEGADDIQVQFKDGEKLTAKVVGVDKATDIALLKVSAPKPLPALPFGDSSKMRVGDWVMAEGNPLGQGFSVTAGIISAKGRTLNGTYDNFFQTDAAINRGNSGGPLINLDGQVIGVNTAILSPNGGSIGIGFSMASNVVQNVVDQLQKYGVVKRGWLGVRIQDVTPEMADALGLPKAEGAMVTDVPKGPAADAGMKSGDVIVKFNGTDVPDTRELVSAVGNSEIGKTVPVVVFRGGKDVTLNVTLGKRAASVDTPVPVAEQGPAPMPQPSTVLGMKVMPLTSDLRKQMGVAANVDGVVIENVDGNSEAFMKGLRQGDIITEAGQQKVTSVKELEDRIKAAKDAGRK